MVFITYVPTKRNGGQEVTSAELEGIINGFWIRFGGATVEKNVDGHWVNPQDGKYHFDPEQLKVTVACDSNRLKEVEEYVLQIGKQLDQKSMYLEIKYFDGVRFLDVE